MHLHIMQFHHHILAPKIDKTLVVDKPSRYHFTREDLEWPDISNLTLDEFYLFNKDLLVDKYITAERLHVPEKIEYACKSMRKKTKHSRDSYAFRVNVAMDEKLDAHFTTPEFIQKISMYPRFYPRTQYSRYLRKKSKTFYAYQEEYKSTPKSNYGGLSEWFYITCGQLTITTYEPTELNIMRYYALDDGEPLNAQEGTTLKFDLAAGDFFFIPPGWIYVIETKKAANTYGGHLLNFYDMANQLKIFDNDVTNLNGRYSLDRDAEIRAIYWFFTIFVICASGKTSKSNKEILDKTSLSEYPHIEDLRKRLQDWHFRCRKCHQDKSSILPPEVFAPNGIRTDHVLHDLRCCMRKRKPVHRDSDSINVSLTQASTDDKSD